MRHAQRDVREPAPPLRFVNTCRVVCVERLAQVAAAAILHDEAQPTRVRRYYPKNGDNAWAPKLHHNGQLRGEIPHHLVPLRRRDADETHLLQRDHVALVRRLVNGALRALCDGLRFDRVQLDLQLLERPIFILARQRAAP